MEIYNFEEIKEKESKEELEKKEEKEKMEEPLTKEKIKEILETSPFFKTLRVAEQEKIINEVFENYYQGKEEEREELAA